MNAFVGNETKTTKIGHRTKCAAPRYEKERNVGNEFVYRLNGENVHSDERANEQRVNVAKASNRNPTDDRRVII